MSAPPCWAAFFCAAAGYNQDDYDVLEDGVVVGRISKEQATPQGRPWMWASGHNGDIKCADPLDGHDLALGLQMMLRIGDYEKLPSELNPSMR